MKLHDATCPANYGVGTLFKRWSLTFVSREAQFAIEEKRKARMRRMPTTSTLVRKEKGTCARDMFFAGFVAHLVCRTLSLPSACHSLAQIIFSKAFQGHGGTSQVGSGYGSTTTHGHPSHAQSEVLRVVLEAVGGSEWSPSQLTLHYFGTVGILPLNPQLSLLSYGLGTHLRFFSA